MPSLGCRKLNIRDNIVVTSNRYEKNKCLPSWTFPLRIANEICINELKLTVI